MGATEGGSDGDIEARIQVIAGLSLGAFAAVSLLTAVARAETGLGVAGAVGAALAVAFVAVAAFRLRKMHRGTGDSGEG
ncbi:hypothetical protein [Streptomonospora sp. PA3]|uniref:hypothetical protein n=1 Tax=Streptomonospora sp. PA3 TaxID=2607326 RepID=UPI0012DC2AF0|nr:hypothetical protein [Streptomonospora sp. PA3]